MREERLEMLRGLVALLALEQQERESIVRTGKLRRDFERPAIRADRFLVTAGARERDRHVHVDLGLVRTVAQREPVRRKRCVVVTLSLQRQRLAQIVESLWLEISIGLVAEEATPP